MPKIHPMEAFSFIILMPIVATLIGIGLMTIKNWKNRVFIAALVLVGGGKLYGTLDYVTWQDGFLLLGAKFLALSGALAGFITIVSTFKWWRLGPPH